jgi:hypothetical protein
MIRVCRQTELAVRPEDESVALTDALEILASRGIGVIAHSLYADWSGMVLLVVTEDVHRAKRALEATGFECESNAVIMVEAPEEIGVVASLGAQLHQAGVPIEYSHMATSGDEMYFAVFKTRDDDRAVRALQADVQSAAA